MGSDGVLVPYINTADEAKQAVSRGTEEDNGLKKTSFSVPQCLGVSGS